MGKYSNGLTVKQEKFCHFYLETGNASEAYRRAYSCEKMTDKSIWEKSSTLLKEVKVSERVAELQQMQCERSAITKDGLLKELSGIAFSSIADMQNTWIDKKDFEKLTKEQKSAIKSISTKVIKRNIGTHESPEIVDVEYIKIELYDKLKAIERICKMLGFDEPEKIQNIPIEIKDGLND
ncbi:MAG: terminase small subunit [Bacteroidales bacterium]|nr:terminase small subunit [Bacteroidales bacterium]